MSRNLPDQPAGPKRKPGTAASGKKSGSISAANRAVSQPVEANDGTSPWVLRLFVAGQSPKSLLAYSNLKKICEQYLKGNYRIELVDLVKEPHLAQKHQIVAVPTLLRQLPEPVKRVIGDLSNHERALVGIDLNVA